MKGFLNTHLIVSINLFIIALLVTGTAWYVHSATRAVSDELALRINAQTDRIAELAVATARNGADEAIASAVEDCSRRDEFDTLLGKLGSLSYKELIEVQQLFESCGSFYAERKALMVSRMERELEVLEEYVALRTQIDERASEDARSTAWKELVAKEIERSILLKDQVVIQGNIIALLMKGSGPGSREVRSELEEAQQIMESLSVIGRQVEGFHDTLIN